MAGQKVDDIRVGLGLSLGTLEADASAAKATLAQLEKPREIPIRISVQLKGNEGEEVASKLKKNIQTALNSLRKDGTFDITPRFSRNTIAQMKKDLKAELKGSPIEVAATVKMTQADGARIRRDIEDHIGVVKIGFDWYWVNQPPQGGHGGGPAGGGGHHGGGGGGPSSGSSGPGAPSAAPGATPRQQKSAANKAAHAAARSPSQAASDAKAAGQSAPPAAQAPTGKQTAGQRITSHPDYKRVMNGQAPATDEVVQKIATDTNTAPRTVTRQIKSATPAQDIQQQSFAGVSGNVTPAQRNTARRAGQAGAAQLEQQLQDAGIQTGSRVTRRAPKPKDPIVAQQPASPTASSAAAPAGTTRVPAGSARGVPAVEPNVRGRASRRGGFRSGNAPRPVTDPGEALGPSEIARRDRNQQIAEDRAQKDLDTQEADRRVGVFPEHSALKNAIGQFQSDPVALARVAPHAANALLQYEQDPENAGRVVRGTEVTLGSRRHGGSKRLRKRIGKARAGKLRVDKYDEQGRYLGPVDDTALFTDATMSAVQWGSGLARDPNAILRTGAGKGQRGTRARARPKNVATPEAVRKQIAKGITADVQTPNLYEAMREAATSGMTLDEVLTGMKTQDPSLASAKVMALDPEIQPQRREDTRKKVLKESQRPSTTSAQPGVDYVPPAPRAVTVGPNVIHSTDVRYEAVTGLKAKGYNDDQIIDSLGLGPLQHIPKPPRFRKRGDITGMSGGGDVDLGDWWRGGLSTYRDLWTPGSGRPEDNPHGLPMGPMSTIGKGLYLTDEKSAWEYARYRAGESSAKRQGASPVVGRARVGIDPSRLLRLGAGNRLDPDLNEEWIKFVKATPIETRPNNDWLASALRKNAIDAARSGRPNPLHQKLPGKLTQFLQGRGYDALLGEEGGEGTRFDHPSLVVFDPKKHVKPYANGGILAAAGGITFRRTDPTPLRIEALEGAYPFGAMDFAGVHPDNLKHVLTSLEGLGRKFPFTARHITGVGTAPTEWFDQLVQPKNRTANRPGVPYAITLPGGGDGLSQIMLNSSVFGNPEMGKNARTLYRADPAAIIAHEFGHSWDMANAWRPSAMMGAQQLPPVSEYGKHNAHESLAELFTKAWAGGDLTSPEERLLLTPGLKYANGGQVQPGGLLARLLASTTTGTTITPGMESRSQQLNALLGIARGGTPQSGGAMLPEPAPMSAAADRRLRFLQGRAGGGWISAYGRGGAYPMYHGTMGDPFQRFDLGRAEEGLLFGPGAYMTDSKMMATTYSRGTGSVLRGLIPKRTRLLDLEDVRKRPMLGRAMVKALGSAGLPQTAVTGSWPRSGLVNWDGTPHEWDLTSHDIDPYSSYPAFQAVSNRLKENGGPDLELRLQEVLKAKGYQGFRHKGGQVTGGRKHNVNILWDANTPGSLQNAGKTGARPVFHFGQEKRWARWLKDYESGKLTAGEELPPSAIAAFEDQAAFIRSMQASGAMMTDADLRVPGIARPVASGVLWHDAKGNVLSDRNPSFQGSSFDLWGDDPGATKKLKSAVRKKGFKGFSGGGVSPWVRRAQSGQLPASDRTGAIFARQHAPHWASGQLPPLADHPGAILAGERGPEPFNTPMGVEMLGLHGPEVVVPRTSGFVVANHKQGGTRLADRWRQLALRSMDEMETRAGGGSINPGGAKVPTIRYRVGNRFASGAQAAQAAIADGSAAMYNAPSTMRVIVLNWPTSLTSPGPSARPGAGQQQAQQQAQQGTQNVRARRPRNQQQAASPVTNQTPPGANNGTGPGTPAPTPTSARPTPKGQARAFTAALSSLDDIRSRLEQVRIGVSDDLQLTPVRALSVSVGQQAQEIFGGRRGIRERARVATFEANRASRFASAQEGAQRRLDEQREATSRITRDPGSTQAQKQKAIDELKARRKAVEFFVPKTEEATLRAEILRSGADKVAQARPQQAQQISAIATALKSEGQDPRGVLQRGNVFKAQALGVAGIVGGTVLFSAAMAATQAGLMAFSKVIGNSIEVVTNFAATTTRVAGEMSASVQGRGNLARSDLAGQFATTGISGSLLTRLTDIAQRQAGAENFVRQSDMLRSDRNLGSRGDFDQMGTFQGFGNGPLAGVPGLGWIGQTPGIVERFSDDLKTPANEAVINNLATQGMFGSVSEKPSGDMLGDFIRSARLGANFIGNTLSGQTANAGVNSAFVLGTDRKNMLLPGADIATARAANAPIIANVNTQATKGGFKGQLTELAGPELDKSLEGLAAIGPETADFVAQLRALGMGLKTANGALPSADQWKSYWNAVDRGSNMPSTSEVIAQMTPQMTVAARGIQRNQAFSERYTIPVQTAAQLVANPLSASATQGITSTQTGILGGQYSAQPGALDPAMMTGYVNAIGDTRGELNKLRDEGIQTMLDLGVPRSTIDSVGQLGADIRGLQDSAEDLQLGYQTAQYNRQLFIAKRALSDVIGLQGKSAAATSAGTIAASKMGTLQRAQLEDERELARIQIARSRREIQFNLALSRLSTPGATAEERATRRAEAEAIAREQRKSLDIQERSTLRGFKIQDIGIDRDARDAIYAIKDLQTQQGLQIQMRGIEKLVEAKTQMLQVKQAYLDTAIEAGISLRRLAVDAQGRIEEATGDFTDTYAGELETVFGLIVKDSVKAYNDFIKQTGVPAVAANSSGSPDDRDGTGGPGMDAGTGGPGFRAPRAGLLRQAQGPAWDGSAAPPVMLNVNFNGPVNVRDDRDLDRISRMVERAINEKAALLGAFGRG